MPGAAAALRRTDGAGCGRARSAGEPDARRGSSGPGPAGPEATTPCRRSSLADRIRHIPFRPDSALRWRPPAPGEGTSVVGRRVAGLLGAVLTALLVACGGGTPARGRLEGRRPLRLLRLPGEPDPGGGLRRGRAPGRCEGVGAARDRHPRGGRSGSPAGRRRRGRRLPRDGAAVRAAGLPGAAADAGGDARRPQPDAGWARGDRARRRCRRGPERLRRDRGLRRRPERPAAVGPDADRAGARVRRPAGVPGPPAVPAWGSARSTTWSSPGPWPCPAAPPRSRRCWQGTSRSA